MKIGIPKAMIHYQNPILYEAFFKNLGIEVVFSEDTNSKIVEVGKRYAIDETCLASKIYLGHVANLVDRMPREKIDAILIPRVSFFSKRETVCVKFYAMYDICNSLFNANFLDCNIDVAEGMTEFKAFLKLGLTLNKRYADVVTSYIKAKKLEKIYEQKKYYKQKKILEQEKTMKVLIVSHPYISYDSYIGLPIIQYLKKNHIDVIFADSNIYQKEAYKICEKKQGYRAITKSLYWKYNKNLLNGLSEYQNQVDGIIYLSTFPCGPDALVNELVLRKVKSKPSIQIIVDEQEAGAGLYTRLESFIDILEQKQMKVSD